MHQALTDGGNQLLVLPQDRTIRSYEELGVVHGAEAPRNLLAHAHHNVGLVLPGGTTESIDLAARKVTYGSEKKRMVLLVSRHDHALMEILWRWNRAELHADVPMVISNHEDAREAVPDHRVAGVGLGQGAELRLRLLPPVGEPDGPPS